MLPFSIINQYGNIVLQQKFKRTVLDAWGAAALDTDGNLYAMGINGKYIEPVNGQTFTLVSTNVKDFAQAGGTVLLLRDDGTLWTNGDRPNYMGANSGTKWNGYSSIPGTYFDAPVKSIVNCTGSIWSWGVITENDTFYLSGQNQVMGIGSTSGTSIWQNCGTNVKTATMSDNNVGIKVLLDGSMQATGTDNNTAVWCFGNNAVGASSTYVSTGVGLDIDRVYTCGYTSIAVSTNKELYVTGQYYSVDEDGVLQYDSGTGLKVWTKVLDGVEHVAFGGSIYTNANGKSLMLVVTKTDGTTWFIGDNANFAACVGDTSTGTYRNWVQVPYTLDGDSYFIWAGTYNNTVLYGTIYNTTHGVGMAGQGTQYWVQPVFDNRTGVLQLMDTDRP